MKKPNYLITFVIFFIGIIILGFSIYHDITNFEFTNQKLQLASTKDIYLEEGKYTIFINESDINNTLIQGDSVTIGFNGVEYHFDITIQDEDGNSVDIKTLPSNVTLELNGNFGILQFEINQTGNYTIETTKDSTLTFPNEIVISNIFNNTSYVLVAVFKNIGIGFLTGVGTLISFVVIYRKRKRFIQENKSRI